MDLRFGILAEMGSACSSSEGTALRLWIDDRPGLAVAYGIFEPELLVDKAIALSQLNEVETIELAAARIRLFSPELILKL